MGEIYDKLKKIQEQKNETVPVAARQQPEVKVEARVEMSPRMETYASERPRRSNPGIGLSPVLFTIATLVVVVAICVLMINTANNYLLEKRNLLTQINSVQRITDDNAKSVVFFTQEVADIQTNLKSINRRIDDANEKFSRIELQGVKHVTDIKLLQQENSDLSKKIGNFEDSLTKLAEEIEALKVKPKK